jgi:hypothetical protein
MKQIPQKAQKWKVRNHKGDFRLLLLIAPSAKRVKQSHAGTRILNLPGEKTDEQGAPLQCAVDDTQPSQGAQLGKN